MNPIAIPYTQLKSDLDSGTKLGAMRYVISLGDRVLTNGATPGAATVFGWLTGQEEKTRRDLLMTFVAITTGTSSRKRVALNRARSRTHTQPPPIF